MKLTFFFISFKPKLGLSSALSNCPTMDTRIDLAISHFSFDTVAKNPTPSTALTMDPVHYPEDWVMESLFLVAF